MLFFCLLSVYILFCTFTMHFNANIIFVIILGPNEMPRLETVESCIKLSQMVIQALDAKASPLQQLPHIRPDMLRHFVTKRVSLIIWFNNLSQV